MPHRILILSASVGAGHTRAAEAVELALRHVAPGAIVRHVDVLSLTNALFRRVYAKAYLDLVGRAPHLVGLMYDLSDRAADPRRAADRLRVLVERLNTRALIELVKSEPWDVIVNTHFLAPELISRQRRKHRLSTPLMTVVTDFDAHGLWVHKPTERYFAATDEAAMSLRRWGVDAARIRVTGIPIHPVFSEGKPPDAARARHGLDASRPVVLVLAGGFGVGPVEALFRGVLETETPVQVVAVCGKNEALRKKLERVAAPNRHRVTVLGFTREMDELMAAADLVVSKPGGLTTSECLARGVPMVIVNPIPGQESRNSDYLLEHGAAIKINNPALTGWKLTTLIGDAPRLAALRANAAKLGRPRAAFEVAEAVLGAAGRKLE